MFISSSSSSGSSNCNWFYGPNLGGFYVLVCMKILTVK